MADRIEPIETLQHPCAYTTRILSNFNLGIVKDHRVLCCLICSPYLLLSTTTAHSHVRTHFQEDKPTKSQIQSAVAQHDVHPGTVSLVQTPRRPPYSYFTVVYRKLNQVPTPIHPSPPLPFLPMKKGFMCLVCPSGPGVVDYIWRTPSGRTRHFNAFHKGCLLPSIETDLAVIVQSFSEDDALRNDFRVEGSLAAVEMVFDEIPVSEVVEAYLRSWTPIKYSPSGEQPQLSLKNTQPFVMASGWGDHVSRFETSFLLGLVAIPPPSDPLFRLYRSTILVFEHDQTVINKIFQPLRKRLMESYESDKLSNELNSDHRRFIFQALQEKKSREEYGQTWARLLVFVIRCFILQSGCSYPITFTKRQATWAERALAFCNKSAESPKPVSVVLHLSCSIWLVESSNFDHLVHDQFDDFTARFAVLDNLRSDGTLNAPKDVTYRLVRLKYVMREGLFLWARTWQHERQMSHSWIMSTIMPSLVVNGISPFANISTMQSLANHYSSTTTSAPHLTWTDCEGLSLNLMGHQVNINDWKGAISALVTDFGQHFEEVVLKGMDLMDLGCNFAPRTSFHDLHANTDPGYSFLEDTRNPFPILRHHFAKAALAIGFQKGIDSTGSIIWDLQAIDEWLHEYSCAIRRLALVMHLLGGSPSRGSEFVLSLLVNSRFRVRNFYWIDGRLVFILFYSKCSRNTGHDRVVVHSVPWCITKWFLVLYGVVRPFATYLLGLTGYDEGEKALVQHQTAFALRGIPMTSEQLSRELQNMSMRSLGFSMGLRLHRHLCIAIQNRHLAPHHAQQASRALSILDAQAGHSSETAERHYAIDAQEFHAIKADTLPKYVNASIAWWIFILGSELGGVGENSDAIQPHDSRPLSSALQPASFESVECSPTFVNTVVRAVISPLQSSMRDMLAQFISEIGSQPPATIMPAAPVLLPAHLECLNRFTGQKGAQWKSLGQSHAFALVSSRQTSVLAILPTGGGKSLLFAAMPMLEQAITVVVLPLVALREDQIANAKRLSIPVFEWNNDLEISQGLVVVSAETAVQPSFISWAARMISCQYIARIVFDEVHLVLTSEDYRPKLQFLAQLSALGSPMVYLTATMPPAQETELQARLGAGPWSVVREPTQRPELLYRVARLADESAALASLHLHVQTYLTMLEPGETLLIHCRSTEQVEHVARVVGGSFYISTMHSEEKAAVLQGWMRGKIRVLVATTALGAGVNHPACRGVLHFNYPYGMVEYAQESGRAGRDGLPAVALMFTWSTSPPVSASPPFSGYPELLALANRRQCQRLTMSRWLDGPSLGSSCASICGQLCGSCHKLWSRSSERAQISLVTSPTPTCVINLQPGALLVEVLPRSPKRPSLESPSRKRTKVSPMDFSEAASHSNDRDELASLESESLTLSQRQPISRSLTVAAAGLAPSNSASLRAGKYYGKNHHSNGKPSSLRPLGFANDISRLKTAIKDMEGKCVLCLFYGRDSGTHFIDKCPYGNDSKPQFLNNIQHSGMSLSTAKKSTKYPSDSLVCFRCWYPLSYNHPLRERNSPVDCPRGDQLPQLCWLLLSDPTRLQSLKAFFQTSGPLFDAKQLLSWVALPSGIQDIQLEYTIKVHNIHLLLLWFLEYEVSRTPQ